MKKRIFLGVLFCSGCFEKGVLYFQDVNHYPESSILGDLNVHLAQGTQLRLEVINQDDAAVVHAVSEDEHVLGILQGEGSVVVAALAVGSAKIEVALSDGRQDKIELFVEPIESVDLSLQQDAPLWGSALLLDAAREWNELRNISHDCGDC